MVEPSEAPSGEAARPVPKAGVHYRREDSPAVSSRAAIALIDVAVAIGLIWGTVVALRRFMSPGDPLIPLFALALAWVYLVALKYFGPGTIGYLIFGVQIVNLSDERPGLVRLTLRTLLGFYFNPIAYLGFAFSETSRQCLRDKLTGTYVVKKNAVPAGHGEYVHATTFFLSMALVYREVKRKD